MNNQIRKFGLVLALLFVLLFGQLTNTQVIRAEALNENPLNNRTAVSDFSSPRGVIQTADGAILANSVPVDDEYEQLRQYPEGELFGHITGHFSFNYGSEGLERTYNEELTGQKYQLRNIGDLLTERVRTNNVTVSLTKELQQVARDQLAGRRGAVVALNPQDGAVLAMYSNPSYDPEPLASHDFESVTQTYNALVTDESNPMLPRAYRESYPPGSTYKPITATTAYEYAPEAANARYPVLRFLALPNSDRTLSNFGGSTCGGTMTDLLRVSCNTGFAQMGIDIGAEGMNAGAEDFGFNDSPPMDTFPGPAVSRFPTVESMERNAPRRAYSAIGQQDVSATPLQMALAAAGIANEGTIMRPWIMKEIRDNNNEVVDEADPQEWKQATSPEIAQTVKDQMIGVAAGGTAVGAQIDGVEVAAKTGTAQTGDSRVHAWLISFAPANDPQVAVAVILENQPGFDDTTGGRLAAPIAKAIMSTALGASE
jgi:penicillin-binding protein A